MSVPLSILIQGIMVDRLLNLKSFLKGYWWSSPADWTALLKRYNLRDIKAPDDSGGRALTCRWKKVK